MKFVVVRANKQRSARSPALVGGAKSSRTRVRPHSGRNAGRNQEQNVTKKCGMLQIEKQKGTDRADPFDFPAAGVGGGETR